MNSKTFVHRAGELAHYDSFAGMVPVKVITVTESGDGWRVAGGPDLGSLEVKVTATRGAYRRGEVFMASAHAVIPRTHSHYRNHQIRIDSHYRWEA